MSMTVTAYKIRENSQTVSGGQIIRTQVVWISCICDTAADLPDMNYVTSAEGTMTLAQGSRAFVIANSSNWILNGAGIWVETVPPALADTYSKQQIDSMFDTVNTAIADAETRLNAKIDANTALLATLIDNGAKNVLQMTQTQTSITRTSGNSSVTAVYDKKTGTVTLNGTHYRADNALIFELYSGNAVDTPIIPAGTYNLSGVPAGGSTSTYRASLTQISGAVDTGNGSTFTLANDHYGAYRILVSGDCTLDNIIFRPMICLKSYYDISPAFVPYCPTLPALYAMVQNYHS